MDPKTIIRNDANIEFKFFYCPRFQKRVRAGKCTGCVDFPCNTLSEIIKDEEKEYCELVKIGDTMSTKEFIIKRKVKVEVVTEDALQKRCLPDGCEVYKIKNKYRVENKLVKSKRKQRDFLAHKDGSFEFENLKDLQYNSGDIIHEIGPKSIVQKVLVKVEEPKKRGRRKKKKKKSSKSSPKKA